MKKPSASQVVSPDASSDSSVEIGIVADNLATVRRLQHRWAEAAVASDRAITILTGEGAKMRTTLGGALNNRALLMADQGEYESALDYSERALVILRDELKDDPRALEPFLEDNRTFKLELQSR